MLHTLDAHESIGHFSDFRPLPLCHQYFKTVVMVEMHVHPRHDMALEIVLNVGQFSGEIADMMVVNERDRSDRFLVLIPFLADEVVTNEVSQGLRPVGVLPALNVPVKIVQ